VTDATSPDAGATGSEVAAPDDQEPDAQDLDLEQDQTDEDPDGEDADGAADEDEDLVEIDHKGKTIKVPKELHEGVLRQADYTKKTQEVAATKQALDTRAQDLTTREQAATQRTEQYAKAEEALLETRADIRATESQLAAYAQLIEQARQSGDMDQARDLNFSRLELKENLDNLKAQEKTNRDALSAEQQRATTAVEESRHAAIREGTRALINDPAVKLTQAAFNAVASHLQQTYGIPTERLTLALAEPELYRVARDAAELPKVRAELAALKKGRAGAGVEPAKTVGSTVSATRPATTSAASDKLSTEAWMKQEEERERRARSARMAPRHGLRA
jgi:post-segregation antitoxin (ccd killing protein)